MIKTIFQDQSILVIEKVPGLITISDSSTVETLASLIERDFGIKPSVSIVHRLDKDTSGVMVIAKTVSAHDNLQNQFKDRQVKKEYLALVHGTVEKGGIIDVNITRNPADSTKFITVSSGVFDNEGRVAATEYEPVERLQFTGDRLQEIFSDLRKTELQKLSTNHYNLYTLLKCHPLTGRTHQIRVHLKYINHPIVSDADYAGRRTYRLDTRWCPRQFLHAAKLGFYHPESGEWTEFDSPLPDDLKKALNKLTNE